MTFEISVGISLFSLSNIHVELKWHYHKNAAAALYKKQSAVCSHHNSYNCRRLGRSSLKDAFNNSVFIWHLNAMYRVLQCFLLMNVLWIIYTSFASAQSNGSATVCRQL